MLTTLNNLTFDSLTHLSVQRNLMLHRIYSIFNYHKELSCGPVLIESILLRNALPSPTTPYNLYAHSAIRRSVPESSRARGMHGSEPILKPILAQRSKCFCRQNLTFRYRRFFPNLRSADARAGKSRGYGRNCLTHSFSRPNARLQRASWSG
jgi:hypothetical protein